MLVTTKGRYAMRLMVYIASFPDRKVTLREVAENEVISLKYLEQLAHEMVKAELLESVRGHGGGYMLARDAVAHIEGLRAIRCPSRRWRRSRHPPRSRGNDRSRSLRGPRGRRKLPARGNLLDRRVLVGPRRGYRNVRRGRHARRPDTAHYRCLARHAAFFWRFRQSSALP